MTYRYRYKRSLKTVAQISDESGVSANVMYRLFRELGVLPGDSIAPVLAWRLKYKKHLLYYLYQGDLLSLPRISEATNINISTLKMRVKKHGIRSGDEITPALSKKGPGRLSTPCVCGCGRAVLGRAIYYVASCRKRAQRARDSV